MQDYTAARYLDRQDEVAQYRAAIEEIQRETLDETASRQLLQENSRRYHNRAV